MQLKQRDGTVISFEPSSDELLAVVESSLESIRNCSSIVECADCGERFLVNNQDFHQVTRCPTHRTKA
jgi:hypothetical protein